MAEVVYVIGAPGASMVKIGRTRNLTRRLEAIQRMSPTPLSVLWAHAGGSELEAGLHRFFAEFRSHGEWFDFGDQDPIQAVEEAMSQRTSWHLITPPRRRRTAVRALIKVPGDPDALCGRCGHQRSSHAAHQPHPCTVFLGSDEWMGCGCPAFELLEEGRDELCTQLHCGHLLAIHATTRSGRPGCWTCSCPNNEWCCDCPGGPRTHATGSFNERT